MLSTRLTKIRNFLASPVFYHTNARRLSHISDGTRSKFRILFLGRDEFSCLVLEELHRASDVWENIWVATNPQEDERRRSRHSASPLDQLADSLRLPVHHLPSNKPEFRQWRPPSPFFPVESSPRLNHVIVTASFGRIVPAAILDLFQPNRRLNVHPSLLPVYRGPAPIQHAIMNGDQETGVCIIEMLKWKEGIDAGSVWASSRLPLGEDVMFRDLRATLAREGGKLLASVLRDMQVGRAVCKPQDTSQPTTHAPAISLEDSIVDFDSMTAESIIRRHRAISHQRPLTTFLSSPGYEKSVQLHALTITPPDAGETLMSTPGSATLHKSSGTLTVRCGNGSILGVAHMKQEGKALTTAKDWWNGIKGLGLLSKGHVQFSPKQFR